MRPSSHCAAFLAAALLLSWAGLAHGFTLALSEGDDPQPLHWEVEDDGPIVIRQHVLGGGRLYQPLLQAATRRALQSWAALPSSDVSFREGPVFSGQACPHRLPPSMDPDQVCGAEVAEVDGQSALFFIETTWPFGEEVIALTTVSYGAGGVTMDADISFNGVHYNWSLDDNQVRTDYESIVLHELGHLLGLAHSEEPGAVMRIDYQDGDLVRVLGADDALGIAELYPCGSSPCIGGVDHESSGGCAAAGEDGGSSSGWSLRAAVVPLLLLLGIGLRSGQRKGSAGVALCLLGCVLFLPGSVDSSTALALDVDDLLARSDRVVHVRVEGLDSWRAGIVWTRASLQVLDSWKGSSDDRFELLLPGGWTGEFGTRVFGMPRFEPGEEAMLFLVGEGDAERVVGLAQGKFQVLEDGTLLRDLSGLRLARVGRNRAPREISAPVTLDALQRQVAAALD